MTIESATGTEFLHIVLSLGLLLFAAKIFAELFARLKLPIVLGELVAGIIVGPFDLGRRTHLLLSIALDFPFQ
jgi:Kef-type K+ transport system membrane component KefB